MTLSDDLKNELTGGVAGSEAARRPRQEHPKGWEPGVVWDGSTGTISTGPVEGELDPAIWSHLISDWGLDPAITDIVPGSVQIRAWDANVGGGEIRRLFYYRATLQARRSADIQADVDALISAIKAKRPVQAPPVADDRALFVALSDWQIGKGEGGGSEATVERILASFDRLVARIKELRKVGRPISVIYLVGLGDMIEQCAGHYPSQQFMTDLDRREQVRVVRRLVLKLIDMVLPLVPTIVVAAVPGNHGENRLNGKSFTRVSDNDDLAVFEQVADVLAGNPDRYKPCSVVLADSYVLLLDMAGTYVAVTHMHQGNRGSTPGQKAQNWWAGQALGRLKAGDADILVTGHYHHLAVDEGQGRSWIQAPSMDGGSEWFTSSTGHHSRSGLLTFGVGDAYGDAKWGDLAVL